MKVTSARYVTFTSSEDATFYEQLNIFLRADVRPAVIGVQHVEFIYATRDAMLAGEATGARYLITFGG